MAKARLGDRYTAEKQAKLEAEKAERKAKREEAAARKAEREAQEAEKGTDSSPGKNSSPQSVKPLSGETASSPSDQLPARKTAPPSSKEAKDSFTAGSAAGSGAAKKK